MSSSTIATQPASSSNLRLIPGTRNNHTKVFSISLSQFSPWVTWFTTPFHKIHSNITTGWNPSTSHRAAIKKKNLWNTFHRILLIHQIIRNNVLQIILPVPVEIIVALSSSPAETFWNLAVSGFNQAINTADNNDLVFSINIRVHGSRRRTNNCSVNIEVNPLHKNKGQGGRCVWTDVWTVLGGTSQESRCWTGTGLHKETKMAGFWAPVVCSHFVFN